MNIYVGTFQVGFFFFLNFLYVRSWLSEFGFCICLYADNIHQRMYNLYVISQLREDMKQLDGYGRQSELWEGKICQQSLQKKGLGLH